MSQSDTEKRLLALETKAAYQDKLLSELNEVLLERGQELDRLAKRVQRLEKQVVEDIGEPAPNEPPPHY